MMQEQIKTVERNNFTGLELRNEIGEVHLPFGAKIANLDGKTFDQVLHQKNREYKTYINKQKLNGNLLEVNGACVFRAMEERFFVVAKVGKIHMPFYQSQSGTDGKSAGEWYPFFGYDATWLIKGSVNKENGKMDYHPEVSKISELLNNNLRLSANSFSPEGNMYKDSDKDQEKNINLNEIIPYQHFSQDKSSLNGNISRLASVYEEMKKLGYQDVISKHVSELAKLESDMTKKKEVILQSPNITKLVGIIKSLESESEHEYVKKITGYTPIKTSELDDSYKIWMKNIIDKI